MDTFSVIIPTLNEIYYLPRLLRDLELQKLKPKEIIIVDAHSADGTGILVQKIIQQNIFKTKIRLLKTTANIAQQRNLGADAASSSWLVFLDADVRIPQRDFFKRVFVEMHQEQLDCACPIFRPMTRSRRVKLLFAVLNYLFQISHRVFPSGAGPCIVVKRNVFQQSGGFDTSIKVGEDMALIQKIAKDHRYKVLKNSIACSTRRFSKYGINETIFTYLGLCGYFLRRSYHKIPHSHYTFGKFDLKS